MKRILSKTQSEIFEKIVRALDGRLFRVRFIVVEREGVLRGRVLSCTPLNLPSFLRRGMKGVVVKGKKGFYLPVRKSFQAIKDKGLRIKDFYVSPYSGCFDFLTVIKIRAPSKDADGRGLRRR